MLYMVIERFKNGDHHAVGQRFKQRGRLMPAGVSYVASWMSPAGDTCFQVTEAADRSLLDEWMSNWSDLVTFEVCPVLASADFWAEHGRGA